MDTQEQKASALAEGIIATAKNAANAVRMALLCLPDATIDIRKKDVRGAWRTVVTVTARPNGDASLAHAQLGDLMHDLYADPFNFTSHRDGELRIRVYL